MSGFLSILGGPTFKLGGPTFKLGGPTFEWGGPIFGRAKSLWYTQIKLQSAMYIRRKAFCFFLAHGATLEQAQLLARLITHK